jgi:hypothetical protein
LRLPPSCDLPAVLIPCVVAGRGRTVAGAGSRARERRGAMSCGKCGPKKPKKKAKKKAKKGGKRR